MVKKLFKTILGATIHYSGNYQFLADIYFCHSYATAKKPSGLSPRTENCKLLTVSADWGFIVFARFIRHTRPRTLHTLLWAGNKPSRSFKLYKWRTLTHSVCLNSVLNLNVKLLVGEFNQEKALVGKALVGPSPWLANLREPSFELSTLRTLYCELQNIGWAGDIAVLPSYKISDLNSGRHQAPILAYAVSCKHSESTLTQCYHGSVSMWPDTGGHCDKVASLPWMTRPVPLFKTALTLSLVCDKESRIVQVRWAARAIQNLPVVTTF